MIRFRNTLLTALIMPIFLFTFYGALGQSGGNYGSYELIDAGSDLTVQLLEGGEQLNINRVGTDLSIRAIPPVAVGSVRFFTSGPMQNENVGPYAVRGDVWQSSPTDYNPWYPGLGTETVEVRYYSGASGGGAVLGTDILPLTFTDEPITGNYGLYNLIDASDSSFIQGLSGGETINVDSTGIELSIVAVPPPGNVQSVVFTTADGVEQAEGIAPYAIRGDSGGTPLTYTGWFPGYGGTTIEVGYYSGLAGTGTLLATDYLELTFTGSVGGDFGTYDLIDTRDSSVIQSLVGGETLDVDVIGRDLSLVAVPFGNVGSVQFLTGNGLVRTESVGPYSIRGDSYVTTQDIYTGWYPGLGSETVEVRYWSGSGGTGTLLGTDELQLTFIDGGTLPPGCSGGTTDYPQQEGFESGLGGWSQESTDDFDWALNSGSTNTANTGPGGAFEGSSYLYTEADGSNNPYKYAVLTSPCYDLSGIQGASFSLNYHMYGNNMGKLALIASSDGGTNWGELFFLERNQGNSWQNESVDLSAYVGGSLKLRLIAQTDIGARGDMAIDNLHLDVDTGPEGGYTDPVLSDENYVFTRTYQDEGAAAAGTATAIGDVIETVTYYDGLGRPKQQVGIRGGGQGSGQNLISTGSWTLGSGSVPFYRQNGSAQENTRIMGTGPFGSQELLWRCGSDVQSNEDGGWSTDYFAVSPDLSYRYTVWVKRTGSQNGNAYHGIQNVDNLGGGANGNPYFWTGDLPSLDQWYLLVGVVHGSGYGTASSGISGVYDINGNKVLNGTDFKWSAATATTRLRSYFYYATDLNALQFFWAPRFERLDGTQAPISELVRQEASMDLVAHIGYDAFGRRDKEHLPLPMGGGQPGSYRPAPDVLGGLEAYYSNAYTEDFDPNEPVNAYSETHFEASPLNRILEQGAPGSAWQVDRGSDADHTIKFGYATNAPQEVRLYAVLVDENDDYRPTLEDPDDFYGPGELYKSVTKDENWQPGQVNEKEHTTEEFTDKQGRVVLKRTYADMDEDGDGTLEGEVPHDTYYIYDDYGNLTYVIPPKVDTSDGVDAAELNELCYQYRYDRRNRLMEKKIPGKGNTDSWEAIVYNRLDQPVMTRDPNLEEGEKWLFTKYDAFGRVAYTGMKYSNGERSGFQGSADNTSAFEPYEKRITTAEDRAGLTTYYSNDAFPTGIDQVLTVNYYDSYLPNTSSVMAGITVPPTTTYGDVITNRTQGLATVSQVRVLGTDDWITTVTGYDRKGRVIWTRSINEYLGTDDTVERKLDFTGRVLRTTSTHIMDGQDDIVTQDLFEYDHMGRLVSQAQTINGGSTELIAHSTYDELGQLERKKVGGEASGLGLQSVDYAYNVRGWLTGVNDPGALGGDLFGFGISYNAPSSGTPLYNGNISRTFWATKSGSASIKSYQYSYDPLNRITQATDNTNNYNVSNITYDKMGNIQSLVRNGYQGGSNFVDMDVLDYDYDSGNKLLKVADTGNDNYGFIDRADQSVEFTYDINGNLLKDINKGITAIAYNHLNMPTNITVSNPQHNGSISYVYSANGIKLQKIVNEGVNTTTTDYAVAYQYVNSNLEFIRNFEDGYVYPKNDGSYGYMYYYTDQLDNIRLMYSDADNNGSIDASSEIVKEQHFYPFGLKLEGFNGVVQSIGSSMHKYDYQNQERQDELGLNWLQFKYRMQDPALGRFVSIDPLAADYTHNSTFAFAENKVIKYNELEGLEITLNKFDKLSRDNPQGFNGHATFLANAAISAVNGAIDIFNYAGNLDRADQSGQGSLNKLAGDASAVGGAIADYASNTSLSEFGSDVAKVATDPNTAEDIFGGVMSGSAFTKVSKLGSVGKLGVADELQGAANQALKTVGDGKGAVHGTKVHSEFGTIANKIDNVTKEVSYKDGEVVPYGTKGSVRADAVEGDINKPTAIYDLKTGDAKLTQKNIDKYNQHIPGKPPVKEIKPVEY